MGLIQLVKRAVLNSNNFITQAYYIESDNKNEIYLIENNLLHREILEMFIFLAETLFEHYTRQILFETVFNLR